MKSKTVTGDKLYPFAEALGIRTEDIMAVLQEGRHWGVLYTTETYSSHPTAWMALIRMKRDGSQWEVVTRQPQPEFLGHLDQVMKAHGF